MKTPLILLFLAFSLVGCQHRAKHIATAQAPELPPFARQLIEEKGDKYVSLVHFMQNCRDEHFDILVQGLSETASAFFRRASGASCFIFRPEKQPGMYEDILFKIPNRLSKSVFFGGSFDASLGYSDKEYLDYVYPTTHVPCPVEAILSLKQLIEFTDTSKFVIPGINCSMLLLFDDKDDWFINGLEIDTEEATVGGKVDIAKVKKAMKSLYPQFVLDFTEMK